MKLSKGDLINNTLPILITFEDGDKYMLPSMCMFTILEIKDDKLIIVCVIPKINIELTVNNSGFKLHIFAMRN